MKTVETKGMRAKESSMEQPTLNVGLLGHVAHGKSTLVQALTGVQTAKFKREQQSNMTLKLGYANVKIYKCDNTMCPAPWCYRSVGSSACAPTCARAGCVSTMKLVRHISLIDAPGHSSLMGTALSGAAIMDATILLVAADQPCPCPQTEEHLVAAEVLGVAEHTIVVQNKIDLCSPARCAESYLEIQAFLKGSSAERAPVVPIAAHARLNVDVLCQFLCELPQPIRNVESTAYMRLVRSFDVNKPGEQAWKMRGGVVGGTLLQGTLVPGQQVEVRPGLVLSDGSYSPLVTTVTSLFTDHANLPVASPGGLVGIGLMLDPVLCKGNRLVGQILSATIGTLGNLPPVCRHVEVKYKLVTTEAKRAKRPTLREELRICIGSSATVGVVTQCCERGRMLLSLQTPVCMTKGDKAVLFRKQEGAWKLIGGGYISDLTPLAATDLSHTSKEKKRAVTEVEDKQSNTEEDAKKDADDDDEDRDKPQVDPAALLLAFQRWEQDFSFGEITDCRTRKEPLPSVGEVVLVEVESVEEEIGAYVRLLEYGTEGARPRALIVSQEISKRPFRSMKHEVPCGKQEVAVVLRVATGYVDLSRKRATAQDRQACEDHFHESQIVHRIAKDLSLMLRVHIQRIYEAIIWPLGGRPLARLQLAMHDPSATLATLGLPAYVTSGLLACLRRRLQPRPVKITARVAVSCLQHRGVEGVKEVLCKAVTAGKLASCLQQLREPPVKDETSVVSARDILARARTRAEACFTVLVSLESAPVCQLSATTMSAEAGSQATTVVCRKMHLWAVDAGSDFELLQLPVVTKLV